MTTLLLLLAVPAPAQVVRAPVLSRPVLTAPLAAPRLSAPVLSPALAAPSVPVLTAAALPAPKAVVPASARPLAAAVQTIAAARGDAARAAPVLSGLFEGRVWAPGTEAVVVPGLSAAARPSLSAPSLNAARPAQPPAPSESGWRRAGRVLGRTAGTAFGLWGGLKAGDLAYGLLLGGTGAVGLVLSAGALGAAAWLLRRRDASLGSRLTWGALLASASFSVLGQLVWDVTGLASVGLGAGLLLGAALALYSGGLGRR